MNFIRKIFLKIAERLGLGLSLQPKPVTADDYSDTVNVSLTATVSNSVATLTLQDSDITIEGDSARAKYMQDFLDYYTGDLLDVAAEVSLGTGTALSSHTPTGSAWVWTSSRTAILWFVNRSAMIFWPAL